MRVDELENELARFGQWLDAISPAPLRPSAEPRRKGSLHKRRGRRLLIGAGVAAAAIGGGSLAAWQDVGRSNDYRGGVPGGSPEQNAALADGLVTFEEYQAGMLRFEDCVEEQGFEVLNVALDPATRLFNYFVPTAVGDGCYRSEFDALDTVWQLRGAQQLPPIDVVNVRSACAGESRPDDLGPMTVEQFAALCEYVWSIDD